MFVLGVLYPYRCTDGVKFGTEDGTEGPSSVPNFTSIGAKTRVQDPQNGNFYSDLTKMRNINAPQGRIPCAIFTKFAEFVPHFRMRWVLKFGWIWSRGYGVIGVLS